MKNVNVLVIEDEMELRDAMVSYLNLEGFFAVGIGKLELADRWLNKHEADVIVLDLTLDGEDGIHWLEHKALPKKTSIIIASARGELSDRVKGFELGIDSYLVKPLALEELVAIIQNIQLKKQNIEHSVSRSEWVLNKLEWTLSNQSTMESLKLTKLEELLLCRLAQAPGEAVSKRELIIALNKSEDSYDLRSLEVLIRRLRQKIAPVSGDKSKPIKTIHAVGYSFIESIETI